MRCRKALCIDVALLWGLFRMLLVNGLHSGLRLNYRISKVLYGLHSHLCRENGHLVALIPMAGYHVTCPNVHSLPCMIFPLVAQVINAEGFNKRRLFEILDGLEQQTRGIMDKARADLAMDKGQQALEPWNMGYALSGGGSKPW